MTEVPVPDRQRVKATFHAALEQPSVARAAWVEAACAEDEALQREVVSLLAAHEQAASFMEQPMVVEATAAATDVATLGATAWTGRRLGAYEIVGELGSGGMGRVFLAARADGQFEKQVAIKIMRWTADADLFRGRFKHEREILATFEHPNIARLIDAGTTDDAVPYVVMEYVDGLPIDDYCDRRALSTAARVELFREVCAAVHHAHERQIIHRDLKASNILVTRNGEPKLLDFGIAKLAGSTDERQGRTGTAFRVLTPESAAPEQVTGEPVTPATDVYALGVLLYQLLAGRTPYRLRTGSREELVRAICEEDPEKPSAVATRRDADQATLRSQLAGGIDRIVLKALRKEPARRYASAADLSEDLGRHLAGLPVFAAPDSIAHRARTLIHRKRAIVSAAVVTALLLGAVARLASNWSGSVRAPSAAEAVRSIAILPFRELDPSVESLLGWGMADALVSRLSRIEPLHVRPLGSVMQLGDAARGDPAAAGVRLGVDGVIEGSIQHAGGRVRISARLLDVATNVTIWSDTVEDDNRDLFRVQDDMAIDIARRLAPRIDPSGLRVKSGTTSAAYDAYVKGRYFLNQRTADDVRQAIAYFEQSVADDPQFAAAYSGIADGTAVLIDLAGVVPAKSLAQGRQAARRALELDETLAEAHASLGWWLLVFDFNWPAAEPEFRRALALNPGYTIAAAWYAAGLASQRRFDEALQQLRKARSHDPLSRPLSVQLVRVLYMARRYEEAIREADLALATDPGFSRIRSWRGLARLQLRDSEGALADLRAAAQSPGDAVGELAALGFALGRTGRTSEALGVLGQIQSRVAATTASSYYLAEVYAGLGDTERTVQALDRARDEPIGMVILRAQSDPKFDLIQGDPRLQALLAPRVTTR